MINGFQEMEHEFPEHSARKKDYLFQIFCCSREFLGWDNPKSRVQQFTFQPDLPETFVNGKQPGNAR